MKKIISIVFLFTICITYAQKKTNGTIYIEHPAIITVESMTKAFVSGDTDKVASYLADDFKSYNGVSSDSDQKGDDKATFLKGVKFWKDNYSYVSISPSGGAYPDALDYKKDNTKDVVWVQTWEQLKAVNNKTGVKVAVPIHRLYVVNKDNKIQTIITYTNQLVFQDIRESRYERENGEIYNHHPFINNMRLMLHSFENKDYDKAYSYYTDDAVFIDNNKPIGTSINLTEQKAMDKKFLENYDLVSIDVSGYPDYLHYALGDAKVVQSWWTYKLVRKSDKKKIDLPVFFIDEFNDDGKITSEIVYYSESMLTSK